MCGKEVHKYDSYSLYKKHKQKVIVCNECDHKRKKDPKFRRILRIINWLNYSSYLYIVIALSLLIVYLVEKVLGAFIATAVLSCVILIQTIVSYAIMRKYNV